jgi:hypothetical protein
LAAARAVKSRPSSAAEDMVKPSAAPRRRSRPVSSVIARARGRRSRRRGWGPGRAGRLRSKYQSAPGAGAGSGPGRRAGASPSTTPPPGPTSLRACPAASPSAAPSRPRTPPPSSTSPNTRSNETAHREPLRDYCAAALGGVDKVARGRWGGWGSNPRPADYEKYGLVQRTHYLHGYHGAVPPAALNALVAQIARSTNRSTTEAYTPAALLLCVTSP